jgi:sulfur relay protein TusB/DsrH
MNLHILSRSPFTVSVAFLETLQTDDSIVLVADACYFLQNIALLQAALDDTDCKAVKVFALIEDCELRGLSQQLEQSSSLVTGCSSDEFARLTLTAQHILNG